MEGGEDCARELTESEQGPGFPQHNSRTSKEGERVENRRRKRGAPRQDTLQTFPPCFKCIILKKDDSSSHPHKPPKEHDQNLNYVLIFTCLTLSTVREKEESQDCSSAAVQVSSPSFRPAEGHQRKEWSGVSKCMVMLSVMRNRSWMPM